jgi:hypothetical protein
MDIHSESSDEHDYSDADEATGVDTKWVQKKFNS